MFTYDHGAPDALPTVIGRGYVSLLSPLLQSDDAQAGPRGPFLRQLELVGHLPDEDEIEARWLADAPAALVLWVGDEALSTEERWITWNGSFEVHVFSAHAAADHDGRVFADFGPSRSTLDDPGLMVMLDLIAEQLHSRVPAALAQGIQVRERRLLAADPARSWAVVETAVVYRHDMNPTRDVASVDQVHLQQESPDSNHIVNSHEEPVF